MTNKAVYTGIFTGTVITLYIAYLFSFSLPAGDDFGYILMRQTMSPSEISASIYKGWNGRLTANFFYGLFLPSFSPSAYHNILRAVFIGFSASLMLLFMNKKLAFKESFGIWALLSVILYNSMNGMGTTFFWMGGVTNYIIAFIFFMLAFNAVFRETGTAASAVSVMLVLGGSMCSEALSVTVLSFI